MFRLGPSIGVWILATLGILFSPISPGAEPAPPSVAVNSAEATTLAGSLEIESGGSLPKRVQFRAIEVPVAAAEDSAGGDKPAQVDCRLEGRRFECPLPVGKLDLRLEAPPYAPAYLWDFLVQPGRIHQLAPIRLRPGASLAGWLKTFAPLAPGVKPRVFANRHLLGEPGSDSEARRLASLEHEAGVSSRLFFQFVGLPPGTWYLSTSAPGFSPAKVGPISVEPATETLLEDAIELHVPITLSIYIQPATAWDGSPWRILLKRSTPFLTAEEVVADLEAGLQGDGAIPNLQPGEYRLEVMDVQQGSWLEQLIEVRPEMPPIFLDLPAVRVAGELVMGGKAVAGEVVFGAYGRPRIPVITDDEGRFSAVLPRAGEWPLLVELGDLEIRVPAVAVSRNGNKNLTIRLPATALRGTVYLDDQPVPKASVVLLEAGGAQRPLGSVVTDEKGKFEFLGLEEGATKAAAALGKQKSEWVDAELRESAPVEIELRLNKTRSVSGHIEAAGNAVPGAAVIALVGELGALPATQQVLSGADGNLVFELPLKTQAFETLAFAPGYGVAWRRIRVPPEGSAFEIALPSATGQLNVAVPGATFENWYLGHGESFLQFRVLHRWLSEAGAVEQRLSDLFFQLKGLAPGVYVLCARAASTFEHCVSGDLAAGGELDLDPCRQFPELCAAAPLSN
jgi:hypothetical protein